MPLTAKELIYQVVLKYRDLDLIRNLSTTAEHEALRDDIEAILTSAIQEQQTIIESLTNRISALERK